MITRLFKLQRDLSQAERFDTVGEANLLTSVSTEEGTLSMSATHDPGDAATCYVFEVYADDAAYEVHAASPQFKDYVAMAGELLTGREVYSVVPQVMVEKPGTLQLAAGTKAEVHLVFVDVPEEGTNAFKAAIDANMRTSVATEEGVLVMYATTLVDEPTRWAFWEVYESPEAYAAHRETPHFKQYIASTEALVADKEFHILAIDTLATKGSLS